MNKYLVVASSFIIMLCLGGVYAWSIFVPELEKNYNFSSFQTQLIFGILITVFPVTMVFAGRLKSYKPSRLALISSVLFGLGYLVAGFSDGKFFLILVGIGILAGIGTGFGYLVSLASPVQWFPQKKGLITGIAAAGFGLASVILSFLSEKFFNQGNDVLDVFLIIGIAYGIIILIASNFLRVPVREVNTPRIAVKDFLHSPGFPRLWIGIFSGTFAGLLVIGNLKPIGAEFAISDHTLVIGVSLFAVFNFLGRLVWGFLSDYTGGEISVFSALLLQAAGIFLLGKLELTSVSYLVLSAVIGFGFGSNFVLFAKETSHLFGIQNLGAVYPFVFLGYALAGITGPLTGGLLYDQTGSFGHATMIATLVSLSGGLLFIMTYAGKKLIRH